MSASVYVAGISLVRESNPDSINGTVLGLVNTCVIATGAILQPTMGWILDLNWQGEMIDGARHYPPEAFAWGLAVLPVVAAFGALAALLSKDTRAE
jgi:MFS family permease